MQDVVQIAIEPEDISTQPLYGQESEPVYTDAPHTIEIKTKGLLLLAALPVFCYNRSMKDRR